MNRTFEGFVCIAVLIAVLFVGVWQIKPVVASSTFGYDVIGGNTQTIAYSGAGNQKICGSVFTTTTTGTVNKISVALSRAAAGSEDVHVAIYKHSDLSLVCESSVVSCSIPAWTTWAWFNFTTGVAGTQLLASTDYILVVQTNYTTQNVYAAYDAGSTNQGHYPDTDYATSFPDPLPAPNHADRKYSIYCDYTFFPYTIDHLGTNYNGTQNISPYQTTSSASLATTIGVVMGWMNSSYPQVEFIGDFTLTSKITPTKSNLYFDFSQANLTLSNSGYAFEITNGISNTTFYGGDYDALSNTGTHSNWTGTSGATALCSWSATSCTFDGFEMTGFTGSAGTIISGGGSQGLTVKNCYFHDGEASSGQTYIIINGVYNYIEHCKMDVYFSGVVVNSGNAHNNISYCEFYGWRTSGGHAIYFGGGDAANSGYNNVTGCNFHNGVNGAAIHAKCKNNIFYNNTFEDCAGDTAVPMSLYSELDGYTANDNDIYNNTFTNCTWGMWLGRGDPTLRNLVYDNAFDNMTYCFRLNGETDVLQDTEIYNNTFSATCINLIQETGAVKSLIVNTFFYNNTFLFSIPNSNIVWLDGCVNTTFRFNIGLTDCYMLNMSIAGSGTTNPDGLGWQYYSGTDATVIWTPSGGNSRVDFSVDGANQTTTTSPINITMSAGHVGVAYFSGTPPPVVVTVTLPTNTTYTISTVSVEISASGGTIDTILWNCTFTNGTVVYANTVYTVPTSMTLGDGVYIFNARANNTLGEWDEATVMFTVLLIIISEWGPWWGDWW